MKICSITDDSMHKVITHDSFDFNHQPPGSRLSRFIFCAISWDPISLCPMARSSVSWCHWRCAAFSACFFFLAHWFMLHSLVPLLSRLVCVQVSGCRPHGRNLVGFIIVFSFCDPRVPGFVLPRYLPACSPWLMARRRCIRGDLYLAAWPAAHFFLT